MFVCRKQGFLLSVYVDDFKMEENKQNMALMWKNLMKNVDFDELTSFLDHIYLGCTQRECKPNEISFEQHYKEMFESRISAGASEKLNRQYCHVGNTAQHCRLSLFQESDFAGDLEDSKSTSGGALCIFGSRTFVAVS